MTDYFDKNFEFEKLVVMSFDGSISKEDFHRLDDVLANDSSARKRYFELLKINQSLRNYEDIHGFVPECIRSGNFTEQQFDDSLKMDLPRSFGPASIDRHHHMITGRRNPVIEFLKIAAVVMVCMSAMWFMYVLTGQRAQPRFEKGVPVATLDTVRGVSWKNKEEVMQAGERLYVNQEIKFLTGTARIKFDNNADILLQAPVNLRIKGENLLFLEKGKLSAYIPPTATGFTVLTPVAEVVDYGTEFGVTVDNSGQTETSVFKGEVDLRTENNKGQYKTQRITAGLSGTVDTKMELSDEMKKLDETVYDRLSFNVNINFQPKKVEVPNGFLKDYGTVFGGKSNGYRYGWDVDLTGEKSYVSPRIRSNRIEYDDRRYDTLIHMQKRGKHVANEDKATWEIEVPNGTYKVDLIMGDPMFTNSINNVLIEGIAINDPDGNDNFDTYSDVTVKVSDGRLSIRPGSGADNAKLCFIKVFQK